MTRPRICIFSTVHLAHDVRLFQAQARTLARAGFEVSVIALADATETKTDGVSVQTLPPAGNRWVRLLRIPTILRLAGRQQADLYAFHDPELLPAAALLRLLTGRPVVYDVHEDVPASIRNRGYLAAPLRPAVALVYRLVELVCLPLIAGISLADEAYERYYRRRRTVTVLNYPLLDHAGLYQPLPRHGREAATLVYTGSVTRLRGLVEMIDLVHRLRPRFPHLRLEVVGPIGSHEESAMAERQIEDLRLGDCVELAGAVSHAEVHRRIAAADIGLALLHADPNYVRSLPTKMFEYMMMGRPVVVSRFPLWEQIVDETECGIAVDPDSMEQIETAVARLLEDPERRWQLGENGRRAVMERYNWEAEGRRLVDFYRDILDVPDAADARL